MENSLCIVDKLNQVYNDDFMNFLKLNPTEKLNLFQVFKNDFPEMHKSYFFNKCDLCKNFPRCSDSQLLVCLLC